jgi:uncharacterized protein YjbI with pentapeptide repeats
MSVLDVPFRVMREPLLLLVVLSVLQASNLSGQPPPACPSATGTSFAEQNLTNHNFHASPPGSLVGADFSNTTLNGATFAGQDLTNAVFTNANLTGVDFTGATLNRTCFSGASMNGTQFTFATLRCPNFSGTSMLGAVLGPAPAITSDSGCRTSFAGATLDVNAIPVTSWGIIDFTGTTFRNLDSSFRKLVGANIAGAILAITNFSGIDFTGADLTGVDFSEAQLVGATFDNAAMNGTKLAGANLTSASLKCAYFYGPGASQGSPCTKTRVSSQPTLPANLTSAVFVNADLTNASLASATLSHATFNGSTLVGVSFNSAVLTGLTISGSDCTRANFQSAQLDNVHLDNLILTSALFGGTHNNTTFSNSYMPYAQFPSMVLNNVSFRGAVLQHAVFDSARFTNVDMSCAQLGGASFSSATVLSGTFSQAVMPAASDCCPESGGTPFCGRVAIDGQPYGAVTFPIVNTTAVACPNPVVSCAGGQGRWSLPGWTSRCTPGGQRQVVWAKPDCSAPPDAFVVFTDPKLQACVAATLPGNPGSVLISVAQNITSVNCPGGGITDVGGLEQFTQLIRLDLSGNQIRQFGVALPALETLKIADNGLTTLDLGGTPKLVTLDASGNQLQGIAETADIYFEFLDISENQFATFDLAAQVNVIYADLSSNRLTSVMNASQSDLSGLQSLYYLDVSDNLLPNIGVLMPPNVASLFVGCNPQFSCNTLSTPPLGATTYQNSQCAAQWNDATNASIPLTHPACATSPSAAREESRAERTSP